MDVSAEKSRDAARRLEIFLCIKTINSHLRTYGEDVYYIM